MKLSSVLNVVWCPHCVSTIGKSKSKGRLANKVKFLPDWARSSVIARLLFT